MDLFTIIAAIILAVSFLGFVTWNFKGRNLLVGLIIITSIWTVLGISNNMLNATGDTSTWNMIMDGVTEVFHFGPVDYGETTAIIIFASWFGAVLVETGIASSLIRRVVELAGDKQLVTLLLVSVVTAGIFMSVFGAGSVIAIGQIVLPIFFSLGIAKPLAVGAFIFAVAAGMYVNGGYVSQFTGHVFFAPLFEENINNTVSNFNTWTWAATAVHMTIMIIFIVFTYYRTKDSVRTWAMPANNQQNAPGYTFIVPFIPVLMTLGTNIAGFWIEELQGFSVIFSFMVGIFFGLLLTNSLSTYSSAVENVQKTLQKGISDSALLIGMLMFMNAFSKSAGLVAPIISNALGGSLDWIVSNPLILVIAVMLLAPLALYRGPFMIWGSGIALVSVLNAVMTNGDASLTGTFPLLLVLFYTQPVAITASAGPTQSWNLWALSYAGYEPRDFTKANLPWGWAIAAINILLGYLLLV